MLHIRPARISRTVSLLALGIAIATPAAAQQGPQAEEATDGNLIIVTAQKREEAIQDVPIAISAFSAEALDNYKIESGSELLRAVPNVNFSKSNFSMYNFSIRGIGTKAISASSDPAVAVSFNNTPLIRNRLFEIRTLRHAAGRGATRPAGNALWPQRHGGGGEPDSRVAR